MDYLVKNYNEISIEDMQKYFFKGQIRSIDYQNGVVILYNHDVLDKVAEITSSDYHHDDCFYALSDLLDCYMELKRELRELKEN